MIIFSLFFLCFSYSYENSFLAGETTNIFISVSNNDGNFDSSFNCSLRMFFDTNQVFACQSMENLGDGRYYCELKIPDEVGIYYFLVNCSNSNENHSVSGYVNVVEKSLGEEVSKNVSENLGSSFSKTKISFFGFEISFSDIVYIIFFSLMIGLLFIIYNETK